jgi:hypothetical protein
MATKKSTAKKAAAKKAAAKKAAAKKGAAARKTGSRKAASKPAAKKAARRRMPKAPLMAAALAAPASGPVTLEEARAIAASREGPAVMASPALPQATPGSVGLERQKLDKEREQERARRIREYKAVMGVMKKRGARRPKGGAPEGAPAAPAFAPLQVLAEGDSWFDYPVPLFGGGVIPRLETRLQVPILNLAKAGDEVRFMLGVEERELLTKHLTDGCPVGGEWDVLLFSGGGNDIVANPMALWIKDYDGSVGPAQQINQARFNAALQLVQAGYEDLIELRNRVSPSTQLVFHAYDYAIPDGRGICWLGPWLKPTFTLRKFPSQDASFETVKAMLQQFANMLAALATKPGVTFINGQGTLSPEKKSWHNELHPSRNGFEQFADRFYAEIKALFPARVA